jgi:hypothetical protein
VNSKGKGLELGVTQGSELGQLEVDWLIFALYQVVIHCVKLILAQVNRLLTAGGHKVPTSNLFEFRVFKEPFLLLFHVVDQKSKYFSCFWRILLFCNQISGQLVLLVFYKEVGSAVDQT